MCINFNFTRLLLLLFLRLHSYFVQYVLYYLYYFVQYVLYTDMFVTVRECRPSCAAVNISFFITIFATIQLMMAIYQPKRAAGYVL
jgi:hypothetical protein